MTYDTGNSSSAFTIVWVFSYFHLLHGLLDLLLTCGWYSLTVWYFCPCFTIYTEPLSSGGTDEKMQRKLRTSSSNTTWHLWIEASCFISGCIKSAVCKVAVCYQLLEGYIAVWDGPLLTLLKVEVDKFEEYSPLNGIAVQRLMINQTIVSTI